MKPLFILGALLVLAGCSDDPPTPNVGRVSGGNPIDRPITPEQDGTEIEVYDKDNPCFGGENALYVKHNALQIGPRDFTDQTGFLVAWSICNTGALTSSPTAATDYRLMVTKSTELEANIIDDPVACPGGGAPFSCFQPAVAELPRTVPALPPADGMGCSCHSEIIFVNVPAGQEANVAIVPPTGTFNPVLTSGERYFFYLAPPFFNDPSTPLVPEGPTPTEVTIP